LIHKFQGDNNFVPQDRLFFAGGVNSVRAWRARDLRYAHDLSIKGTMADFARNYIGSTKLIEGSFEYRRKLSDVPGLSDNLSFVFNDLGIGLFLDFGNTFG